MLRLRAPESRSDAVAGNVETRTIAPAPSRTVNAPGDPIALYLDMVEARLKSFPPDVRAEIWRELRQHLEATVAACEELGDSREAAIDAALQRFGEPTQIAERFRRAWHTTPPREKVPRSTLSSPFSRRFSCSHCPLCQRCGADYSPQAVPAVGWSIRSVFLRSRCRFCV
jgi:hypothetical protein